MVFMALWLDLRNAPWKKKSLEISTRTAAAKLPRLKNSIEGFLKKMDPLSIVNYYA